MKPQPHAHSLALEHLDAIGRYLAGKGRKGDTMLAHINRREAELLHDLGGSWSKNPSTGLPEFFGDDVGGPGTSDSPGGEIGGGAGARANAAAEGGKGGPGASPGGVGTTPGPGKGWAESFGGAPKNTGSVGEDVHGMPIHSPFTNAATQVENQYQNTNGPFGLLGQMLGLDWMDPANKNQKALKGATLDSSGQLTGTSPPKNPDVGFDLGGLGLGLLGMAAGAPGLASAYGAAKKLGVIPRDFAEVDVGNWGDPLSGVMGKNPLGSSGNLALGLGLEQGTPNTPGPGGGAQSGGRGAMPAAGSEIPGYDKRMHDIIVKRMQELMQKGIAA